MELCNSSCSLELGNVPSESVTLSQLKLEAPQAVFEESNILPSNVDRCSPKILSKQEDEEPLIRLERSNSCSQADNARIPEHLGAGCLQQQQQQQQLCAHPSATVQLTSVSHDNLASGITLTPSIAVTSSLECISSTGHHLLVEVPPSTVRDQSHQEQQENSIVEDKSVKRSQSQAGRFFTSKLNTGSLWSLLSVGSNGSSTTALEMPTSDDAKSSSINYPDQNQRMLSSSVNSTSNFFTRSIVQFKKQEQQHTIDKTHRPDQQTAQKGFRFNLKYIGSAMLHKNFTLPMLEWIAKDIKRQTIRGAKSTSQRQFCIPTRDVMFEIQANQLRAISCKDGHCVLVHPMHYVSKYAQLQHDPTCFSYLIRDAKDAPTFCHVYQAKSASKVHEIFSAIREATTQTTQQRLNQPKDNFSSANTSNHNSPSQSPRIQRSRSTAELRTVESNGNLSNGPSEACQLQQQHLLQENSYQFEVMFVKRVKLQCRRIPASFVDDALETLRSFEVLKGGVESKGSAAIKSLGKRGIINVSVDERQEYDESCQPQSPQVSEQRISQQQQPVELHLKTQAERRGSSASLHSTAIKEEEQQETSRSCQQSPSKVLGNHNEEARKSIEISNPLNSTTGSNIILQKMKKHQSADCLNWADDTANFYTNDFSPYNTITSSDLNERIAATMPSVSSSLSLDHETRQKLARKVRETIMATAANIKDSQTSLSLPTQVSQPVASQEDQAVDKPTSSATADEPPRRASLCGTFGQHPQAVSNNFDLFRRASARQVVKNRTMLLLIGKEDLCAISIDKHQMLFSKSFSSIVHCLQGINNRDHFGLICRDSGKINPQAEAYAGFIFKCQSDKVVREIMGALKQVIYSSQHNYHGLNSIYNPIAALSHTSLYAKNSSINKSSTHNSINNFSSFDSSNNSSLAAKRGFSSYPIEISEAVKQRAASTEIANEGLKNSKPTTAPPISPVGWCQPKNLIKSMFCDNCPLYWYHRLCCDIESLPDETSKAIILRRIDSSLDEKEQDDIYSRFSEFCIESISEHNEIFMSLLRHLCERKQLKHSHTTAHINAMNSRNSTSRTELASKPALPQSTSSGASHQRSSSSSGSLAFVLGHSTSMNNHSIVDASSAALDNFKKAKNSISSSIDNILKRKGSVSREELEPHGDAKLLDKMFHDSVDSMKESSTIQDQIIDDSSASNVFKSLKKSQSTTDYWNNSNTHQPPTNSSWRDSLSRTINDDLVNNSLVGLFRRQSSLNHIKQSNVTKDDTSAHLDNTNTPHSLMHSHVISKCSRDNLKSNDIRPSNEISGGASPSSLLSSAFWKKSIFDKIRQHPKTDKLDTVTTSLGTNLKLVEEGSSKDTLPYTSALAPVGTEDFTSRAKKSPEELRSLWRKAIFEQITLLKMEKQNQRLQANLVKCDEDLKLNYKDFHQPKEVLSLWEKLLKQNPTQKVVFKEVAQLVGKGVPKNRRGEIWMFLMNQYQLRHGTSFQPADSEFHGDANQSYRDLLSQLSTQQHEIFVDIGRTFPSHPYYSQYLSIGQLSLFNLLKAYSLLDPEVGYCQGLSFVAGILLLHVNTEDEAFELMRHFLFNFGLRKQYLPSMNALHLQLYQITRLLRDYEYELFNHFDQHDISPSLYAAPWFLTLFASQFPLVFVARLFDLISLIGIEAVFRVSLNLLNFHRASLLKCNSLESTMDYMRVNLVDVDDDNLIKIFDKSLPLDLRNKLIEYEIEYTFYCAEERARQHSSTRKQKPNLNTSTTSKPASTTDSTSQKPPHDDDPLDSKETSNESTSTVADATATIIIQHLLANNHLKSLQSNYSY